MDCEGFQFVRLSNGVRMPSVGFGTWRLKEEDARAAVRVALETGYRLIDTASIYKNEEVVGEVVQQWELEQQTALASDRLETSGCGMGCQVGGGGQTVEGKLKETGEGKGDEPRVFLTSKVSPYEMGYDGVMAAFGRTSEKLKRGRDGEAPLDLYLLHWPGVARKRHESPVHRQTRRESWRAMETLVREGRVRSIGVSNFCSHHIETLMEDGAEILPALNQVEAHPLCAYSVGTPRGPQMEAARRLGIPIQAYASLGGGAEGGGGELLQDPAVQKLAEETGRSAAQVLLRWGLQRKFAVIPRSKTPERIAANIQVFDFELSDAQMASLDELDTGQKFCWDAATVV